MKLFLAFFVFGIISIYNLNAQVRLTHSNSLVPSQGISIACGAGYTDDNRYYRVFDLTNDFNINAPFRIDSVEFAIELLEFAPVGGYPVTVRLYSVDTGVFPSGTTTVLDSTVVNLYDQSLTLVAFPLQVFAAANDVIVMEVDVPSGLATNTRFYHGAIAGGEPSPSYIASDGCGLSAPVDLSDIGFPNLHYIMSLKQGMCATSDRPVITSSTSDVCFGETLSLNIAGNLNDAAYWAVYADSCGGDLLGTTNTSSFVLPANDTNTKYYVRGEGNCYGVGACVSISINRIPELLGSFNSAICTGQSLVINGTTYNASNLSGTEVFTNVGSYGCDSTVAVNLTLSSASVSTGTDIQVACDSYTWIDGNTYTSSNNSATHTLVNAAGCDSLVTLDLTINYSNTGTDVQIACDSYTWIDGNTYTSSNNSATHTLVNAAGCDSLVTLDLTINYSNTGTDTQIACDSYTWIDGNTYTSSNNSATHTLVNAAGCDSLVTLDLTINYSNTGTDVQVACDSYTWIDGNTYTSSNNVATHTLTNVAGCDSIVALDLTINNSTTGTDIQVACDSYTWIDGNTYTSSNNSATHTLVNAAGCDSLVTLDLTINYSNTGTDVQVGCDSYTWIDGNTYTASNNSATHTLVNAAGCDSIVTLDLTIGEFNYAGLDTSVVICLNQAIDLADLISPDAQLGGVFLTPAGDQISGSVIISNAENVYDYTYEVSSEVCPTSSATISITVDAGCDTLSVNEEALFDISVFPNPTSSILTILNPSNEASLKVEMLDMKGRVVLIENSALNNASKVTLAIDKLETGVYTLRIYNAHSKKVFKIVKR
ncbi:T9SS type A sorting domain-containing protein [Brumimicrobium oceani]|nr:T9SS type A sorting domain-containing protein [Brumimicrobium oceani]